MTIAETRTISLSIDRDWREVYDYLSSPPNFSAWASGLGSGLEKSGKEWIAQGPTGPVGIRFSPHNAFGVLDHLVTLSTGAIVPVPMRVIPNQTGCEVMLTVFRMAEMSDEQFAADTDWVARDLAALKKLLET